MRLRMLLHMITAYEFLITLGASKPLLTSMSPMMSLHLIGTRKSLFARLPVADERTFTGVPAQVSFQMRCFAIKLPASGNVTAVDATV